MVNDDVQDAQSVRLRGWKEISRHLRADPRTARRWEDRGLPIHRLPGAGRSAVFAIPAELDRWLRHEEAAGRALDSHDDMPAPSGDRAQITRRRYLLPAALLVPAAIAVGVGWPKLTKPVGATASVMGTRTRDAQAAALVDEARMQNGRATPTGFRRAIDLSNRALARDPANAPAYAELAFALIRLPDDDATVDRRVAYEHAQQAAQRALDIDPNSWRAHSTMGFIEYGYHWNFIAGIRHFREVIRINPTRGPGHNQLGLALLNMGDVAGALRELKLSAELETTNPIYRVYYALGRYVAGNRAEAVSTWRQILGDNPNMVPVRAMLFDDALVRKDYREAVDQGIAIARLRNDRKSLRTFLSAQRNLAAGKALAIPDLMLKNALAEPADADNRFFNIARLYGLIGDNDHALAALKEALDARESDALTLRNDPLLASVRTSPRFEQLAATYGITPAALRAP